WSAGTAFGTLTCSGDAISLEILGGTLGAQKIMVDGRTIAAPSPLKTMDFQ
ncbi:MAG: Beta-glucosidase, partial [Devosia sp.]|nr:Beta-glucosidase [Devosia sp.]